MVDKFALNQLAHWEQIEKEAKIFKKKKFEGTGELSKLWEFMEPRSRGKEER